MGEKNQSIRLQYIGLDVLRMFSQFLPLSKLELSLSLQVAMHMPEDFLLRTNITPM